MSGTYTVQLTASTGCTSISSIEVKVYDQIHAVATASEDTICEGQSLQLHAEGGSTYQWNGPNGFTSNEQGLRIDNITPAAREPITCLSAMKVDALVTQNLPSW
ncbi:MAG: hypothetical protein IPP89_12885 [Saprospiraceae bacterium]|nr:hypothetical protein [Candidatus Brachybacter algidus]MBL0119844.1 hypothetical protein [Candidatus Brachybacter algidus]